MIVTPNTRADMSNQATKFTFNQPVEVPGNTVLPAGTYWFEVVNGVGITPDYVQILNADQTGVLATLHTIPTKRTNALGHVEVTYAEPSGNQPVALINWFYPGRVTGHEFVYSPAKEATLSESEHITAMVRNGQLVQAG